MSSRNRIIFSFLLLFIVYTFLIGRLFYIQVIRHPEYSKAKQGQYISTVKMKPKRGIIYDRNFNELAVSLEMDSIYAVSNKIDNKRDVARKLASVLDTDYDTILKKLEHNSHFDYIAREVDEVHSRAVRDLGIEYVGFEKESKRFYPEGRLANQVIGFVGTDNKGLCGIEQYFDKYLEGYEIVYKSERDAHQKSVLNKTDDYYSQQEGKVIVLTIDKTIQHIIERELEKAMKNHRAKAGTIIVQNSRTGEILALANRPTFDNEKIEDISLLQNRAVSSLFEPGSTFKVATAAAALQENIVDTGQKIFCENGFYNGFGPVIRDHEKEGWLTFAEVIEKSSNIGMVKVAEKLDKEKLFYYTKAFGFGELTNIQLPSEVQGMVSPVEKWNRVDFTRICFGQGIAVTPLQLITAVSSIANDGRLMKPYIVRKILGKDNTVIKEYRPQTLHQVISPQTAHTLTHVLKGVVTRGTGKLAAISGYQVAGKTGTAQKIDKTTGLYSNSQYIASFVGYFPADDPQITILVIFDEPDKSQYWGSTVCAPVFSVIGQDIGRYLDIVSEYSIVVSDGRIMQ